MESSLGAVQNGADPAVVGKQKRLKVSDMDKTRNGPDNDVPRLPADVEAEFRKIFDDYDTEGSGAIAVSDFPLIAKDLGEPITDEEAHFIEMSIDPEGTGVVAFNDFIRWWRKALV